MFKKAKRKFYPLFLFFIFLALSYLAFVYFFHKPNFKLFPKNTISYSGFVVTIDTTDVKINSVKIAGGSDDTELIGIYENDQFLDSGNEIKIRIEFKPDGPIVKTIKDNNLDYFYLYYSISYESKFFKSFVKDKIKFQIDFDPPTISNIYSDGYVYLGGIGFVTYDTCLDASISYVNTGIGKKFFPLSIRKNKKTSNLVFFTCFNKPCNENKIVIVAEDDLGNSIYVDTTMRTIANKLWNISDVKIQSDFLLNKYNEIKKTTLSSAGLNEFMELNIEERERNDQFISAQTSLVTEKKLFDSKFMQMENSKVLSEFSEKRIYYLDNLGKSVDSKFHFGYDLSSIENANVYASNGGIVSYINNEGLGIYGKLVIVNHGLGFYSFYSHLSSIFVQVGEKVNNTVLIGKTGQTGYAFGDHLHFGTYIQGVPFDSIELWDQKYINQKIINIYNQFIQEKNQ